MSLIRPLLESMAEHATATAIVDGEVTVGYADLDRLSASIAGGLRDRGAGTGDLILLYSTRTWSRCATMLGAWRIGAGVLSVDPGLPRPRAERIVRGARPRLLVREDSGAPFGIGLPECTYQQLRGNGPSAAVDGPVSYVVATSGSTGEPKLVAHGPQTLAALGAWHRDHWRHEAPAHTLHAAAAGFDVGYEEIVTTLLAGATLVVASDRQRRDAFELLELIRAHRVARTFQPVGGLHSLAMTTAVGERAGPLREIVASGERLVINDEVRKFCADNQIDLINEYGPSETHVITQYRLSRRPWSWPDHPPLGTAVAGAELLRLADGALRPFQPGERAELVIAGPSVALGYLDDEELTRRRFRTCPHRDGQSRRGYLSGDLVRFDGASFHFVSRVDDQLKVNGYRVEPAEVEAVLGRQAGVRRAAVIGVGGDGAVRLAACYTPGDRARPSAAELREACAAELPDYMVPAYLREMDALPLTANGKVDRAALRALFESPDGADPR